MSFKSSFPTPAVAAISLGLIGGTVPAPANIINVPGDYPTIQAAINAASNGDEIVVAPGIYNDDLVDFLGKAITLRSTDPTDIAVVEATILERAEGSSLVVRCQSVEGPNTVLDGFLIRNGFHEGDHGGGMGIYGGSSPTVRNCIFENNSSGGGGGGIGIIFSSAFIDNCIFRNNISPFNPGKKQDWGYGGGLLIVGDATVTNCTFVGNSAGTAGGGILVGFGIPPGNTTIINCCFIDNDAPDGGGIAIQENAIATIAGSSFCNNSPNDISGTYNDGGGNEFDGDCECSCLWDLDTNGNVGATDLLSLLVTWGPCDDCNDCPADFDDNGTVGATDLLALLVNWGPCP